MRRRSSPAPLAGLLGLAGLLSFSACDQSGTSLLPTLNDGLPASCSPLRTPGACMMPWPNALYLRPDATTATGFRLALTPETLPVVASTSEALDPTRWNLADGFSPAGTILYDFAETLDPASLVAQDDIAASLQPGAATVLVDMASGQLVAHFSGVDENVIKEGDRQGLLITPAARLLPAHRYAVAITTAVRTLDGKSPTPPPLFQAIAQGTPPTDALSEAQAARMPDILAALAAAGVPRSLLVVAWDFVTGSDTALTGHVLSMRDRGLGALASAGLGYTITSIDEDFNAQILRRIRGTFTAPQFLDNEDESRPEAALSFDDSGAPQLLGTYQAPFTILVPAVTASRGPLPILVYGHGIFGSGEEELGGAGGSFVQDFASREGTVVVATDWIGLSSHESPTSAGNSQALALALTDFNDFPWITDRLQQALVSTMALERTMVGAIVGDAAMTLDGHGGGAPVADPTRVTYYGNSLGGIMGMSFMGYDPDVTRAALGCGGGFWATLFERSVNWKEAKAIIPASYPDSLDQQLLLALAQMQFDYSDPATVAPYVLGGATGAPLAGVPAKQILLQMGLDDAQVSNVATEMVARTAGLPLLSPAVVAPFGLTATGGPLASALTTWDVGGTPVPPDTNQTPDDNNQVHEAVRRIPQAEQQIETFLTTGQVVDTCGGQPCVEPVPPGTPAADSL